MKIIKTNDKTHKTTLSITKADWLRIGQQAGWEVIEDRGDVNTLNTPFNIQIQKYGNRFFAVYLNGELLCVTVYRKGAMAVESVLGELAQRIEDAEGRVRMVG